MFVTLEASERYADSMVYVKTETISILKQRLRYIERQLGLSMANDSLFQESVDILGVTRKQLEDDKENLLNQIEVLNSDLNDATKKRDKLRRRRNFWRIVAIAETAIIATFVIVKIG